MHVGIRQLVLFTKMFRFSRQVVAPRQYAGTHHLRGHRCARGHSELCEHPTEMSTYCPRTDLQHGGDCNYTFSPTRQIANDQPLGCHRSHSLQRKQHSPMLSSTYLGTELANDLGFLLPGLPSLYSGAAPSVCLAPCAPKGQEVSARVF